MTVNTKTRVPAHVRVRSIIDRICEQGGSVIYQKQALYPVLEVMVRIREKSRDQLGDFEENILRFAGLGICEQIEMAFVIGFPETKLVPMLNELAGRGLLTQDVVTRTRFNLSELGKLTLQHGVEVIEADRAILLCGLTGRLLPRDLYELPSIDPAKLKDLRFVPDLIQENSTISLKHLNLDQISNKRLVNLPDEAVEICGIVAGSPTPKFLDCEILLFRTGVATLVELYFAIGKVDWLDASDVLGLLEPLGYPLNNPTQAVANIATELGALGLKLAGGGSLDLNGNPVFIIESAQDKFFTQKFNNRLYAMCVGIGEHLPRPISPFSKILNGRTLTLIANKGSAFASDIERLRYIENVTGELKKKKNLNPEALFELIEARSAQNGYSYEELRKLVIRTGDTWLVKSFDRDFAFEVV